MKKLVIKKAMPILLLLLFAVLATIAFYKGNSSNAYTTATAITALGFLIFGFYFQYFRDVHKVSFSLIDASFNGRSIDVYCTFENTGTNKEIIIGVTFIFPEQGSNICSTITQGLRENNLPELLEPFILPPNSVELKHFHWEVSYDDLLTLFRLENGQEFEQEVNVEIDFVDPITRTKSAKHLKIGTIKFYGDFASFSKIYSCQNQLF